VVGTVQFAQLEVGSFATSFIPTGASPVTRAGDNASMTGSNFSSWYNQSEGTFLIVARSYADLTQDIVTVDNGNILTSLTIYQSSNAYVNYALNGGGLEGSVQAIAASATANNKIAACYKTDSFGIAVNGTLGTTDTSGTPPTVNRFVIAPAAISSGSKALYISSITYFPKRLSNTQLQTLSL